MRQCLPHCCSAMITLNNLDWLQLKRRCFLLKCMASMQATEGLKSVLLAFTSPAKCHQIRELALHNPGQGKRLWLLCMVWKWKKKTTHSTSLKEWAMILRFLVLLVLLWCWWFTAIRFLACVFVCAFEVRTCPLEI